MIARNAQHILQEMARQFPVVTVTGPRQSGKTTLTRMTFHQKDYVNLERPDTRSFAETDPVGFLAQFPQGAIIDEIQHVPELLSYVQSIVDEKKTTGLFILTGSNQFEYLNSINQSLAGRTAILKLLPFSYDEIYTKETPSVDTLMVKGFYPRIFDQDIEPDLFYSSYVSTHIERDVRNISSTHDLSTFQRFMGLCAGRAGSILNKNSLAHECGISSKTVENWLSILEASYIIYRLQPYHRNWNKRIVKSPKLYFFDTGLAAYLLNIQSPDQLSRHPLRGELFENLAVTEILKQYYNRGKRDTLYFFRDSNGNEVDIILDTGWGPVPLEIKSSQTVHKDFFKGLRYFAGLEKSYTRSGLIIGRDTWEERSEHLVAGYASISKLVEKLLDDSNFPKL